MGIFKLNKEVSESSVDIDADDILNVKAKLKDLGYYKTPEYGMNKFGDSSMFDGIRKFQKEHNLTQDGIIKPQGETETMFNKILRNGEYASSAAQQGLTLGWADETEGIAGGVGYGIGSLNKKWNKTGETFGQAFKRGYIKTRDARRANLEEGYKRNPTLTGSAEVLGAISSPAKFSKISPLEPIKNLKRKNLIDAVAGGAIYGTGSTNENKDYAKNIGLNIIGNVMGSKIYDQIGGNWGNPIIRKSVSEATNSITKSTYEKAFEKNQK